MAIAVGRMLDLVEQRFGEWSQGVADGSLWRLPCVGCRSLGKRHALLCVAERLGSGWRPPLGPEDGGTCIVAIAVQRMLDLVAGGCGAANGAGCGCHISMGGDGLTDARSPSHSRPHRGVPRVAAAPRGAMLDFHASGGYGPCRPLDCYLCCLTV